MVDEFATVRGSHSLLHFPEEPLIVVHEALNRLLHKGTRVATAVGGEPVELGL